MVALLLAACGQPIVIDQEASSPIVELFGERDGDFFVRRRIGRDADNIQIFIGDHLAPIGIGPGPRARRKTLTPPLIPT